MSFFSRKQEMKLEDFCRDFYDTQILSPVIGKIDADNVFSDVVKKNIVEVYPEFAKIDSQKLNEEIKVIRFELFALAWTHKFISGENVVAQSDFTKSYLHEKGRNDIWVGMESYNNMIDSVTLHWLTNLGKMNLSFNYNMREDLTKKNIEAAKELGIENDDRVARVNHRLWSENAWKQKLMLGPLVFTFCERIGVNAHDLNQEAQFRLAATIKGLYDGAEQSWDKVKIKS
ncbi:MAG: hypothetical protein A2365_03390 [Candidatus Nealsonbacteria bacterium RIFOXYB1_FULL_40_15]|uniref:Uncharacterized protein n=1 Tax=Candidatus Nealsonbacteria bacterium RIFOXYB1_FULL_40_15 TaxID=1801677 RepID=A0A1G2ENY9_9BACT|nr:MAG: hypothetical protein A2365_03390 [Candidatus Nealsonbacteria bacterium RIFOXYB1_FULL_40_15]